MPKITAPQLFGTLSKPACLKNARDDFPIFGHQTYLDTAHKAAVSRSVASAVNAFYADASVTGGHKELWNEIVEGCREAVSHLLNVRCDEIGFTRNASEGLNLLAHSIPFQTNDNVVISDLEHETNAYPWRNLSRQGIELRVVKSSHHRFDLNDIDRLVDRRTRVLALSHIYPSTGFRPDVIEIGNYCRENEIFFILDSIQALGAVEADLSFFPVDAVVTSGHKWLCGPYGIGVMYSRIDTTSEFQPIFASKSYSVTDAYMKNTADYKNARKWEYGSLNYSGIAALKAAVENITQIGLGAIEAHISKLTRKLRVALEERGVEIVTPAVQQVSGILCFALNDVSTFIRLLEKERISASVRGRGYLRISLHYYNNESDIEHLIYALDEYMREPGSKRCPP